MFCRQHMHSSECCHYVLKFDFCYLCFWIKRSGWKLVACFLMKSFTNTFVLMDNTSVYFHFVGHVLHVCSTKRKDVQSICFHSQDFIPDKRWRKLWPESIWSSLQSKCQRWINIGCIVYSFKKLSTIQRVFKYVLAGMIPRLLLHTHLGWQMLWPDTTGIQALSLVRLVVYKIILAYA